MIIKISPRFAEDSPEAKTVSTFLVQAETEAEKFQIEAMAKQLFTADVVNYDEADSPYRSTQICLPLVLK